MANVGKAGRGLDELMAELSAEDRAAVEAQAAALKAEIDGLRALRKLANRSQEQIAQSLGVKQPAVVKIERQADLYLSTLRRFVEAAGGTLELRVELPGSGAFVLTGLGSADGGIDAHRIA